MESVTKKKEQTEKEPAILEETQEEVSQEVQENEAEQALETDFKAKYEELYDTHLRTLAEYENYKRRTIKEKSETYVNAQADTVRNLLPALDNLERALLSEESSPFKDGVAMIMKQIVETLEKMGVTEIPAVGETFNPALHEAVMHIEDETLGENTVAEQFAKGYMLKDKVIRHSVVKVAN